MSEMPVSIQQAIDIVEDECFLNDFSPVEKTKSRKILWRVGNIIRDRIKASAAARCSADSEHPVAWRYTCQDGSQVLMLKPLTSEQKRRGYYIGEDGEDEVGGDDAIIGPFHWAQETPLYAAPQPARTEPQSARSEREAERFERTGLHVEEARTLDDPDLGAAFIIHNVDDTVTIQVRSPGDRAFSEVEMPLDAWTKLRCVGVDCQADSSPQAARQPIETAPKDGTHILAWRTPIGIRTTNNTHPPTVVHWFDDPDEPGFYTSVNERAPEHPFEATHWMPLPHCQAESE